MISSLLTAVLLPLAMWGMLSALVLQLIALRGLFIQGGEAKLRLATLAFALGVVLIQRLTAQQGRSTARAYGLALGGTMLLFVAVDAFNWRVPAPPLAVFAVNAALLGVLWWAGHRITAACAADGMAAQAAGESGILGRRAEAVPETVACARATTETSPADESEADARLRRFQSAVGESSGAPQAADAPDVRAIWDDHLAGQREGRAAGRRQREADAAGQQTAPADDRADDAWTRRLGGPHPGRALLYFALVAVPVFGLGTLLQGGDVAGQVVSSMRLFLYLWCTLTLLWLAGLGQLRAYFERRGVSLPEVTGLTWIALGSAVVLAALAGAFVLPQPPSPGAYYVRQRIQAVYRGWEADYGIQDQGGSRPGRQSAAENFQDWDRRRYQWADQLGDQYLSDIARQTGFEPEARNVKALSMVQQQTTGELFDWFLRLLYVLAFVVVLAALYALVVFGARGLGAGFQGLRLTRRKDGRRRDAKRKQGERRPGERAFAAFADPFFGAGELRDGDALVRYLWQATLALCADRGAPCPPDATPREFVSGAPEPLAGMEEQTRWLANLFCFSEFSGRPVPDEERPRLRDYWRMLRARGEASGRV